MQVFNSNELYTLYPNTLYPNSTKHPLLARFFPNTYLYATTGIIVERGGDEWITPTTIKVKHVVEPDTLLSRRPNEPLVGAMSPDDRFKATVAETLRVQADQIERRIVWMAFKELMATKQASSVDDIELQIERMTREGVGPTVAIANKKTAKKIAKNVSIEVMVIDDYYTDANGLVFDMLADDLVILTIPSVCNGAVRYGAIKTEAKLFAVERLPTMTYDADIGSPCVMTQSAPVVTLGDPTSAVCLTLH